MHYHDHGPDKKSTMPVCLSPEKLKLLAEYAKKKGMTNYNQAIEDLATKNNPR
jgi:ribosomal protein S15P/S13E